MNPNLLKILLAKDSVGDADFTVRALMSRSLANRLILVQQVQEGAC